MSTRTKKILIIYFISMVECFCAALLFQTLQAQGKWLQSSTSPVLFKGDEHTAYRDPAVLYNKGKFYLYFTLCKTEDSGKVYSYTAMSTSTDLKSWTPVKIITPRDQSLDFSSPGNIIRYKKEWVMCLQTYPRPDYTAAQMPRFANKNARLYIMRSKDLLHWSSPVLLKVKGATISEEQMGRMIDPYLLQDKDTTNKYWCFYKQNGVSMSYSYDLDHWQPYGYTASGENTCVLAENNEYILFHSPKNGIGIKHSYDLKNWRDTGNLITLAQQQWQWAKGRITAGTVINLLKEKNIAKYLMFFHGSGPLTEEQGDFDKNASIGLAWSDDLLHWDWAGKQ